jgi:Fur family ferric uptake transcriptional regulator
MSNVINPRASKLREYGYKLTKARLTVLKVLEESGGHMTSAEVLEAVSVYDPTIGRASVFRTLELFTQLALIRPTYLGNSMTPAYVLLPDGHHHHIICTECSRVIDFDECGLMHLTRRLQNDFNMTITGHLLEFYGVCDHCREEMSERS